MQTRAGLAEKDMVTNFNIHTNRENGEVIRIMASWELLDLTPNNIVAKGLGTSLGIVPNRRTKTRREKGKEKDSKKVLVKEISKVERERGNPTTSSPMDRRRARAKGREKGAGHAAETITNPTVPRVMARAEA